MVLKWHRLQKELQDFETQRQQAIDVLNAGSKKAAALREDQLDKVEVESQLIDLVGGSSCLTEAMKATRTLRQQFNFANNLMETAEALGGSLAKHLFSEAGVASMSKSLAQCNLSSQQKKSPGSWGKMIGS